MIELARITRRITRYAPHLMFIVGLLAAGKLMGSGTSAFPAVLVPLGVAAAGAILAFVFPPNRRR